MLNGFEIFLICVSVILVSVHSWFPLLMSPPDSDVAGKRIEPHITGSLQGAAAQKCAHTVSRCFPSSGCSEGTKLATRLQQNLFFVLLLMPRNTYLCLLSFSPLEKSSPLFFFWRKAVWVSHAGDFDSSGDSPSHLWVSSDIHKDHWLGNCFPSWHSQAASGCMAKFPDRPHPLLASVQVNNMLCKSCHHTLALHIFSVSPNL